MDGHSTRFKAKARPHNKINFNWLQYKSRKTSNKIKLSAFLIVLPLPRIFLLLLLISHYLQLSAACPDVYLHLPDSTECLLGVRNLRPKYSHLLILVQYH